MHWNVEHGSGPKHSSEALGFRAKEKNSICSGVQYSWHGVLARTSDRAVAQAGSLNGLAARFRLESARPFADEAISDMLSLEIRSLAETCVPAYWEPPLYFEATGAQVT